MAIARIGAAAATATTVALPGSFQNGDLIIMYAADFTGAAAPTSPAGWTNLFNQQLPPGGTGGGYKVAWRLITSASDTSGTWSSAVVLSCAIYRGQATSQVPVVATTGTSGTASSIPSITLGYKGSSSWIADFLGTSATDSTITNAPSPLITQASSNTGSGGATAVYDSNGIISSPVTLGTNNIGGTAGAYGYGSVEIRADFGGLSNYEFVKVGDGMSTTEKIR